MSTIYYGNRYIKIWDIEVPYEQMSERRDNVINNNWVNKLEEEKTSPNLVNICIKYISISFIIDGSIIRDSN